MTLSWDRARWRLVTTAHYVVSNTGSNDRECGIVYQSVRKFLWPLFKDMQEPGHADEGDVPMEAVRGLFWLENTLQVPQ